MCEHGYGPGDHHYEGGCHPEAIQSLILRQRVTKLRAQRDEARAARDACLEALTQVYPAVARVERVEALVAELECEPGGSDYHRKACPGCSLANRVRAALEGAA